LKTTPSTYSIVQKDSFQFHAGSIKRDGIGLLSILVAFTFQFHAGSIKSHPHAGSPPPGSFKFQFHAGSIKSSVDALHITQPGQSFNSTLVRLKVAIMGEDLADKILCVSIPRWFD
jgi:hypothetical protein